MFLTFAKSIFGTAKTLLTLTSILVVIVYVPYGCVVISAIVASLAWISLPDIWITNDTSINRTYLVMPTAALLLFSTLSYGNMLYLQSLTHTSLPVLGQTDITSANTYGLMHGFLGAGLMLLFGTNRLANYRVICLRYGVNQFYPVFIKHTALIIFLISAIILIMR